MVLYLGKMPIISMYVCYYILVIESSSWLDHTDSTAPSINCHSC